MKIKKILAALMAITLIGGAVNAPSQAAQSRTLTASAADYSSGFYEELIYNKYADHIEITNCSKTVKGELSIPAEIGGLPVTSILRSVFMDCQELTSVIIPDSVTTIEEWAFAECVSLEAVKLPGSLKSIEAHTFSECTSLQNITIPDSVTSIGERAFMGCTSLTDVTVPESVNYIDDGAFGFCLNLESIIVLNPECTINDFENLGTTIFNGFVESEPDRVYFDGIIFGYANSGAQAYAEKYGYSFKAIEDHTEGSYEDLIYRKYEDHVEIVSCKWSAKSVIIPAEIEGLPVTVISSRAFWGCQKITSLIIPDSVTAIGYGAFSDCDSLRSIEISDSVTTIEEWAFANCTGLEEINLPGSLESIGSYTFLGCTSLQCITLPDSITKIEEYAFADCASLISITIPANVKSIEDRAFAFCTNLKSITILNPECVIHYDDNSGTTICNGFIDDDSDDVYFDGIIFGYENSGAQAYAEKCGYEFIAIEDYTEGTYEDLTYKKYADRIEIIGCKKTAESVVIPDEIEGLPVTRIDHFAFMYCNLLKSVTIPDSVTSIGNAAFANTGLTEVTIPDSVNELGDIAFSGCDSLTSVKLPDNLTEIATGLFQNCHKLGAITIPESVTIIGAHAFRNCGSLISVTVPESVIIIRNFAFEECESLESITILNPDCEIQNSGLSNDDIGYTICNKYDKNDVGKYYTIFDGTIYGYEHSTAHAYAEKFGYNFEIIKKEPEYTEGELGIIKYRKYSDHIEITNGGLDIPEEIEGLPVTVIASHAFYRHIELKEITIPKTVTKIESWAFSFCRDLQKVTILNPDCEIYDDNNTFFNVINDEMYGFFNGTIYGYEGSTAQAYAEKYGRKFESLGEAPDDKGEYTPGDANLDGIVDIADAVLIMQCISNPNKYGVNGSEEGHITEQGYKNADCTGNDGVTNGDALAIQSYLLGLIESFDE